MLKKILSLALALAMLLGMFNLPVSAAKVGDPLGDVLYSDITAYINGSAIPTSIKSGTTMVVVEDLANYGFDVSWDGKAKSLRVELNAGKKVTPLKVEKNTKPVGTFKCKYVYTDIKTYLSGQLVESFAINGVTLIDFELLAKYGSLAWDGKARTIKLTTAAAPAQSVSKKPTKQIGSMIEVTDVKRTDEIFPYLEYYERWLYVYNDNSFKPDQYITYGEFIELLVSMLCIRSDPDNKIREAKSNEHWAWPYVEKSTPLLFTLTKILPDSSKLNDYMIKVDLLMILADLFGNGLEPAKLSAMGYNSKEARKGEEIAHNINDYEVSYDYQSIPLSLALFLGWFKPDEKGNIYPNTLMTKADVIKLMWDIESKWNIAYGYDFPKSLKPYEVPYPKTTKKLKAMSDITDVKKTDSVYPYLEKLFKKGACFVYENNSFKPDRNITYGEFFEMLTYVIGGYENEDFWWYNYHLHWAYDYVDYISSMITNFDPNDYKDPTLEKYAPRYDIISICMNTFVALSLNIYMESQEGEWLFDNMDWNDVEAALSKIKDMDSNISDLYRIPIGLAIYWGWISPDANGNINPNKSMTRGDAVKLLCNIFK